MNYSSIDVPKGTQSLVLFQRTQYSTHRKWLAFKIWTWLKLPYKYRSWVGLEARLRSKKINKEYSKDMFDEFCTIRDVLPSGTRRIIDIGCGLAGIDAYISNHFAHNVNIVLLDKSLVDDKIFYMFHESGAFYNSLNSAKQLLCCNDVPERNIVISEVHKDSIFPSDEGPFDVVISLLSWGFHYPVETYLDNVMENISESGILVLDVRKNTTGRQTLQRAFRKKPIVLYNHNKFERLCFTSASNEQFLM